MRGIFNFKSYIGADRAGLRLMCAALALAAMPMTASAGAMITEIMYDAPGIDTGREWIEVQNTGGSAIDLSSWKLFEANVNHKIAVVGPATVPAGGFAILVDSLEKFRADNPSFTGLVFDTAFSLGNEGETLTLRDESGSDADSVSYLGAWGAAGDGNTLQKSAAGTWIAAAPTIGLPTSAAAPISAASSSEASSTAPFAQPPSPDGAEAIDSQSVNSGQEPANVSVDKPQFLITIGRPRIGFVGAPLFFEARVKESKDLAPGYAIRSSWSMGDGTELMGQFVSHAYLYPGEYVVVANSDANGQRAVSKTLVKVVAPSIEAAVDASGAISVSNLDRGEANLGGFIVEDAEKRFILPRDTIVRPRSSIRLAPSVTGIERPRGFVRVADPTGKVIAERQIADDDPVVALPSGLDEKALRERILQALKNSNER